MPQALATVLVPWISNALIAVGASSLAFGAAVGGIALGASYLLLAGAALLVSQAFQQQKPEAPKPEDGKYALKQSVPPLTYVLGQVKKSGDYIFLEERAGAAFHIVVDAAHYIQGYALHYLHDEVVTLDGSGLVVAPAHFAPTGIPKVRLESRVGANVSTAYSQVVSTFPEIWTADHRGDGLASVLMVVESVPSDDFQSVYPVGMPQRSSIINGHAGLVDPRTGSPGYSTNLALFRYWHLTHPVGGKMTVDDLYTPDWANAANVCDQNVTNRSGGTEKRYNGGFWFRADNDPVQIGRLMDQAGEMVLYERPDGKVGVHAGEFVEPDVRLTANDIVSISYDPNKRRSTNVIAVRGRYTEKNKGFNTVDAAIYGVPYPTEDERTKTVENQVVQSHNHMARLQKLAYLRANAPRVKIVSHFEPARNVPYRRFIKVHYPPKMTEAIVEITGRPTLSLRNLTYEFEGIVLEGNPYLFNAATEEGVPGGNVLPIDRGDVPVPTGFALTIQEEDVGGSMAKFGRATWTAVNSTFTYELEWQPTAGGLIQSTMSLPTLTELRSLYLSDGVQYRFRLRTWSSGARSNWTSYIIRTA